MLKKILSTGMTGAEQAGLAAAFMKDISTGGYAMKDYKVLDGKMKPLKYMPELIGLGLIETEFEKLKPVFEKVCLESDAHIIFQSDEPNKFETNTSMLIKEYSKPVLKVNIDSKKIEHRFIVEFLRNNDVRNLHITGKLDSGDEKRIYTKVLKIMTSAITDYQFEMSYR